MTRFDREEREELILDAASDVIARLGIDGLTMPVIAQTAKVSRQYLYEYFHSVDEVVEALFERVYQVAFVSAPAIREASGSTVERAATRLDAILGLPLWATRVITSAILITAPAGSVRESLRRRVRAIIEVNWINPLIDRGVDPRIASSSVGAIVTCALYYRELIAEEALDRETALRQLLAVATALVPPSPDVTPEA